ncbi:MAG: triose-phosphate isomerase [Clostridia bacterium]|nr:triose-phosphate isomerase [Clostridia bacterium]
MRRKVIAGNWKMNKTPIEVVSFMETFPELVKDAEAEVILCAPYIDVMVLMKLADDTNIKVGVQNMHYEESGAYTGEVSPKMLRDIGVDYVIIGHSERRAYYNETDESVNKKLKAAFNYNLKPILCVGETLEQREEGITKDLITTQTRLALKGLSNEQVKKVIIAYEPIWAIGTGKTATSLEANEAIKWIRDEIRAIYGDEVADEVILQYGGSVKSSNAKELFEMSDIDGGLVGGASLDPTEFSKIVNYNK